MCAFPSTSARTKNWVTEVLTDADQESQLDLLHSYFNDSLNGTTGHAHTGGTSQGPKITLTGAAGVQGTLPIANGGTGVTTLAALGNLFYPVGSLYFNDEVSTNPGTLLGFGTWTAITGKSIIGVDSGDTDFDTAKETGGAKTVSIAHTHGITGTYSALWAQDSGLTHVAGVIPNEGSSPITTDTQSVSTVSIMNPYYAAYIWRRSA